ncbi:MAG: hypothetical protein ABR511_02070 [Acidimicrobiales bacterium]
MGEPAAGTACPSAQPDMAAARVFGVRQSGPDGPRTAYLDHAVDAGPELLARAAPAGAPQVLRIAATCEESSCAHFDGTDCGLATRIVTLLPPVVSVLPRCAIRADCRWFAQEGRAACLRCPQVVTEMADASPLLVEAARPQAPAG